MHHCTSIAKLLMVLSPCLVSQAGQLHSSHTDFPMGMGYVAQTVGITSVHKHDKI